MDMPVKVQVNEDEDTEWNDILRKHKIIPEKPRSPTKEIEAALEQARELAHQHRLEGKDLDELAELEDEEDEDFLDHYRQKRLHELLSLRQASKYNHVTPVQKPEYSKEVTEESNKAWVLVLLTSSSGTNIESQLMIRLWHRLASKWGDIKFCQIQANLCIEGYPDKNTPTILVYKDTQVKQQLVTLNELSGDATTVEDIEQLLLRLGAIQQGDARLKKREEEIDSTEERRAIRHRERKGASVEDEDDDWD